MRRAAVAGGELVQARTADGLRLDGFLQRPAAWPGPDVTASSAGAGELGDAESTDEVGPLVIALHGVGGNFYGSRLFAELAPSLLRRASLLTVNTRGHDSVFVASAGGVPRRFGAACELVDECRLDVAAWCDWARQRGFGRLVLCGHSLGAIKVVYAQSLEPQSAVAGVIAISPPRLSYQAFRNADEGGVFAVDYAEARRRVEAGQGESIMEAKFPFPLLISASTFVDKYGPGERYNFVERICHLQTPTLFTFGALELQSSGVAFAGLDQVVRAAAEPQQSVEVRVIERADHMYSGVWAALGRELDAWLERFDVESPGER